MNLAIGKQLENRSSTLEKKEGSAHGSAKARVILFCEKRLLKESYFRLRTVMS